MYQKPRDITEYSISDFALEYRVSTEAGTGHVVGMEIVGTLTEGDRKRQVTSLPITLDPALTKYAWQDIREMMWNALRNRIIRRLESEAERDARHNASVVVRTEAKLPAPPHPETV